MSNSHSALAVSDRLVGHDKRADAADERQCRESWDRNRRRNEGEQQNGANRATPAPYLVDAVTRTAAIAIGWALAS